MIIKDAIAVKGYGGSFWKDQEAIKTGAKKDGFVYFGSAVTPGFYNIYQPSEAVSIVLFLEGDRIALGDCCSVTYSGKAGRDPLFLADYYQPFIEKNVLPLLIGREITHFKEMAEEFDLIEIIPGKPVPIFTQSSGDWYMGVDKAIMRRSDVFPHANINTLEELEKLSDYIEWTRKRIQKLAGDKYRPYLHYDIYGSLAMKCDNDISNMLKHLRMWQDTAKPYKLIIEEPFDMKSPKGTIEMAHKLIKAKRDAGINVIICADEWCNTLDEIKTFVDNEAAEMIQIKSPDVGGINNIIEAILYCKKQGVYAYLGGSCCETDVSSRVTWHIALATEPFQTLAKPGLGVDESYQIGMNEMNRTLALIRKRLKK
jgi:methylaspartate ammonia-lyase